MTKLPNVERADPLRAIQRWVHQRLGIFYSEEKLPSLEGRLLTLCYKTRIATLEELLLKLRSGDTPQIELQLAHAVSTNHTAFFREPETLDFFSREILPRLGAEPIRIWSAAASTGEEAYTLAMLATEQFGIHEAHRRCSILGTDVSTEVIEVAERGRYARIDGIAPEFQQRYLTRVGSEHAIHPAVARLCTFRRMNLIRKQWPFRKCFRVVLLRNVLYYFDREQQTALLHQVHQHTANGAWLLTSVTESLRGLDVAWVPVHPGVYRRRDS